MNILFHGLKPHTIECYIEKDDEELLIFTDSLLFGPFTACNYYDPDQRYRFWSSLYSPLTLKFKVNKEGFITERAQYDRVQSVFNSGKDITLWVTDDPRDVLLLFTLSSIIQRDFNNGKIFLGSITVENKIDKQQLNENDVREYAACWQSLTNSNALNVVNGKNAKLLSIVTKTLKYLHPFYEATHHKTMKLHLAPIDKDILDTISMENPVSEAVVISQIIDNKEWLGDLYVRARIRILNEVLGILVQSDLSLPPYQIYWTKKENCPTCVDDCITESETIAQYVSRLFLVPNENYVQSQ